MLDMPLSDTLYAHLRDLLLARLGLHFPERRRADLVRGLSQAATQRGHTDLGRLATELLAGDINAWEAVVAQLTIGETYFFRNQAQFAALRERILPDLMARRAASRLLRVWSAGCATGEEPYSLAMALVDSLPAEPAWQVSILGTDINPLFLERAREATYGAWSFRETPDALRERFFTPVGQRWRLKPEIQRMVLLSRLNLAEPGYPAVINGTSAMDLIFCRNVLIYFDAATMRAVIERMFAALAPGGWLVVGHAEPSTTLFQQFETINAPGTVLYRKPIGAPLFGGVALPAALSVPASAAPLPARAVPAEPPAAPSAPVEPLPPPAAATLAAAQAAANRGEWASARTLAKEAAAADPLSAAAQQLLGQLYEQAGELDAALAAYRRSLYLDPARVLAALGMANVWRRAGEFAEARRGYRVALRLIARHPAESPIPDADGAIAAELATYAQLQLDMISEPPAQPES